MFANKGIVVESQKSAAFTLSSTIELRFYLAIECEFPEEHIMTLPLVFLHRLPLLSLPSEICCTRK